MRPPAGEPERQGGEAESHEDVREVMIAQVDRGEAQAAAGHQEKPEPPPGVLAKDAKSQGKKSGGKPKRAPKPKARKR